MEKIKDVNKIIIPEGYVFVEVIEPKRSIIMPDGSQSDDVYCKVIIKTPTVTDLEVGDIIIKTSNNIYGYTRKNEKGEESKYALIPRGGITIAIKEDNFIDPIKLASTITI